VLANPESCVTEVGVEKVLSRLGVQKSIEVGFPSKKAQVQNSMKILEKARDKLKWASLTERRQCRGEVRHKDRPISSDLCS